VDYLLLLMGSNPLPNYVSSAYLLDSARDDLDPLPLPGTVIFLHSSQTLPFAENAITLLQRNYPSTHFVKYNLNADQFDPKEINSAVQSIISIEDCESFHFNYTGGTKPMSAHSLLTVGLSDLSNIIISYTDPMGCRLIVNDLDYNVSTYPVQNDLRYKIDMSFEDIRSLHGITRGNTGRTTPNDLDILAESLGPRIASKFSRNVKEPIKTLCKINVNQNGKIFYKGSEVPNFRQLFQIIENEMVSLQQKYQIEYNPETKNISFSDNVTTTNIENIDPSVFIGFITGKWLEHLVFKKLSQLKDNGNITGITDIRMGAEPQYQDRPCELDVVVMKGYQLFLISCTTSQEIKTIKQKAFEALYRAEQFGGEHAQVIVVSLMYNRQVNRINFSRNNNLEELQKDLQSFQAASRCHLIGIEDIRDNKISEKLSSIIG